MCLNDHGYQEKKQKADIANKTLQYPLLYKHFLFFLIKALRYASGGGAQKIIV